MAVAEQYANEIPNDVVTTLSAGINNSTTTIPVTGFTGFPPAAQYRIRIDDELLLVTAGAGTNSWTATRGAEGTTALSHLSGATVTHLLTRDGLLGVGGQINLDGTVAARPAAGVTGRLHLPSDGLTVVRDTGTLWTPSGPIFPFTDPIDGDYTWVNQSTASVDTTQGGIYLSHPGSIDELSLRVKNAPTPPYKIEGAFIPLVRPLNFPSVGLAWYDGTKAITMGFAQNNGTYIAQWTSKWNTVTSFNATYAMTFENLNSFLAGPIVWFRIVDDNTNRKTQISNDGVHWITSHSVSRTDFLTATKVGFYVYSHNQATEVGIWLLHWKETA